MKIARRETPYPTGTRLRFPHRYLLDKQVFGRRILTEGGIMIDGSGSMRWSNDDLMTLLERMPAVSVGIYSGFARWDRPDILGRICVLAKQGRFSRFDGLEPGHTDGNDVDLEALQLLARWPKPRFWLSDGFVCGGIHSGPHSDPELHRYQILRLYGRLVETIDRFLRHHEILRVRSREDMLQLVKRQRVTLYRTCVDRQCLRERGYRESDFYPPSWQEAPVIVQL